LNVTMKQPTPDDPLIPLDLLRRVTEYFRKHPDEELIPLEYVETMEPITLKKNSTADASDIDIDWIP